MRWEHGLAGEPLHRPGMQFVEKHAPTVRRQRLAVGAFLAVEFVQLVGDLRQVLDVEYQEPEVRLAGAEPSVEPGADRGCDETRGLPPPA